MTLSNFIIKVLINNTYLQVQCLKDLFDQFSKFAVTYIFFSVSANCGGVFNLVLGVSVLSIVELFYYFWIKIPLLMREHKKVMPVILTIKPANNVFR